MNFIISILFSLVMVTVLTLIPWIGVGVLDLQWIFGVYIPYFAVFVFVAGFVYRVINWSMSPNPFRIPTTAGQQKSLPWIKQNKMDNPSNTLGVIGRMVFEVLLFRSLFRNTSLEYRKGDKVTYEWEKWLWIAALAFHYSFLCVVLRHLRFFFDPIPWCIHMVEVIDGFIEIGIAPFPGFTLPGVQISGLVLVAAVAYLLLRRLYLSQVRYISLPADYFPLFLILGIAGTGIMMRYAGAFTQFLFNIDVFTVQVVAVKELAMGLVSFSPTVPDGIGVLFFIHLFLICSLIAYFPFSKLMHMGGIFLSPTRILANNNRAVRHVNPWDYHVKVHTYDEYEEEFREKMVEVGLPVEKMPEAEAEEAGSQEETEKE